MQVTGDCIFGTIQMPPSLEGIKSTAAVGVFDMFKYSCHDMM